MNFAVFASGRGSNFEAIARAVKKGSVKARLSLLICDNPEAAVLKKALRAHIPAAVIERRSFPTQRAFESALVKRLKDENIGLICLAGFMRVLSPFFVRKFKGRILNIHPSLLPSFKGAQAIRDAFSYGVKVTGVTVHFVDEQIDHGPIILQSSIPVNDTETPASLEYRIHILEHSLYPQAINLFAEGRLRIKGRRVCITAR